MELGPPFGGKGSKRALFALKLLERLEELATERVDLRVLELPDIAIVFRYCCAAAALSLYFMLLGV